MGLIYLYLNNYSWVSPQILATLSMIDADFITKVKSGEVEKSHSNYEMALKEIDLLVHPENIEKYSKKEPFYGFYWKENLKKLIKEGKL